MVTEIADWFENDLADLAWKAERDGLSREQIARILERLKQRFLKTL